MSKITLIPASRKGGYLFTGSYLDKKTNTTRFLVQKADNTFDVVTNVGSDQRVFKHNFVNGSAYSFDVDTGLADGKEVVLFFKNHPFVFCPGHENHNAQSPLLELVIADEKINNEFSDLMERLEIVHEVLNMDFDQKEDLCWALQIDPSNMSEKEMIVQLLGANLSGAAIQNRGAAIAYRKMREQERIATIYANKAIKHGIANNEHNVFTIAGQNCGPNVQTMTAVFLSNDDLYRNYVVPEIDRIEKELKRKNKTTLLDAKEISPTAREILPATAGKGRGKRNEPES